MRLFVALRLTEELQDALCAGMDRLRRQARRGRFSRRENLHLTLAFLGDVPVSRLPAVRGAMEAAARGAEPFALRLAGAGRFRREGGDVWWAGVEREQALLDLAAALAVRLRAAGFPLEARDFSPHLTLARQVDAPGLRPEELALPAAAQPVTGMSLMESSRPGGVLTYREIFSVPLGKTD